MSTDTPSLDELRLEAYTDWIGRPLYDRDGDKIGKVSDLYLADDTYAPTWLLVSTGLLGNREHFVPIEAVDTFEDGLRTSHAEDWVRAAPTIDADDEHLDGSAERLLYAHYGINHHAEQDQPRGRPRHARYTVIARTRTR